MSPGRPFTALRKQQFARSDDRSPGSLRPVAFASTQSLLGPIETPVHAKDGMQPGQIESIAQQVVPLARMGQAEEVASVVLFLASEDSSYITGGELFVDGGLVEVG